MSEKFNLSAWGLRHGTLVAFAMLVSLILGTLAYFKLGRAEDPSLTIKVMTIDVGWPGATTREMEQQVVEKIQRTVQEVPHFDYVHSYVQPGKATIFLVLKDSTIRKADIEASWYQARKRVGDIRHTLPPEIEGPVFNDDFGDTFGSIYAFHADGFDDGQMKQVLLAARERLLQVPDVSKVMLLGVQEPRFYVEFSHVRLAQLGIAPAQLLDSLRQQNSVAPAGVVEGPQARIAVRVDGAVQSVDDIANVAIATDGRSFRLGDVATITRGFIDPPQKPFQKNKKVV